MADEQGELDKAKDNFENLLLYSNYIVDNKDTPINISDIDEFYQNITKLKELNELFNSKEEQVNNLFNKIFYK